MIVNELIELLCSYADVQISYAIVSMLQLQRRNSLQMVPEL